MTRSLSRKELRRIGQAYESVREVARETDLRNRVIADDPGFAEWASALLGEPEKPVEQPVPRMLVFCDPSCAKCEKAYGAARARMIGLFGGLGDLVHPTCICQTCIKSAIARGEA